MPGTSMRRSMLHAKKCCEAMQHARNQQMQAREQWSDAVLVAEMRAFQSLNFTPGSAFA
jgi:hypothetical protein